MGVGVIGKRFTQKLVEAEWPVTVYDIDPLKVEAAANMGAIAASSAKEVTERSDAVLLCLPGSPYVEAAMNGPEGILAGLSKRQIIIDTGTTRPSTDIEYSEKVRALGGRMVDAPITGRRNGFIIMVGGAADDFLEARPALEIVGYKVVHIGPLGYGQRMKLVNQFVLAGRLSVYAEAANMAAQLGLDPEDIVSVLEFGEAKQALAGPFQAAGAQYLALHTKDLEYLSDLLESEDIYAPLTGQVTDVFQETRARGERDWTQASIVTHWKAQGGK